MISEGFFKKISVIITALEEFLGFNRNWRKYSYSKQEARLFTMYFLSLV